MAKPKTRWPGTYSLLWLECWLPAQYHHFFFASAFLWVAGRVKIMRKKRDTQQTNTRWLKTVDLDRRETQDGRLPMFFFFIYFFQIHYSILGVRARNNTKKCEHQTTYFADFLLRPRIFTYLFVSHSKHTKNNIKIRVNGSNVLPFVWEAPSTPKDYLQRPPLLVVFFFFNFNNIIFFRLTNLRNSICSLAFAKHSKQPRINWA